jgi:RND superfamily putative drug exporter
VLAAVASLVTRRPGRIAVAAAAAGLAGAVFGAGVASSLAPFGFEDPAAENVRAREAVERAAGYDPDLVLVAIVRPFERELVERTEAKLREEPTVAQVLTAYTTRDRAMVSRDGRATYVLALFRPQPDEQRDETAGRIEARFAGEPHVLLGGGVIGFRQVGDTVEEDLLRAELIAFPLLLVLAFWVFRGLVAALLPPLVGGLTILLSFLGLRLANDVSPLSVFALNLVTGMGLGLAIDWSLLVVSRFREELAAGGDAVRRTIETAGRTVVFSSLTVAAAMASLLVFPQRFLFSMGIGGVLVALFGGAVSLVFLPAVLALLGRRVDALAPRRWQRREDDGRTWYRFSRFVMLRAAPIAVLSSALLLALGLPFLRVAFTAADSRVLPPSASARQVFEQLTADFGRTTTPFYAVVQGRAADVARFTGQVEGVAGVARVRPARIAADTWKLDLATRSDYLSDESQRLVRELRALPTPLEVLVGGGSAGFVDEKSSLAEHLPLAILLIVVTTLVILFLMTGSVVLPLKALVMNALTVSAAFGLLVLIFQDGRLESVLRYSGATGLDFTQPILLFAVAFALSTDYGVFLLSRIKEEHDAGQPNTEAVARGLQRTGRIVTAAALLFCAAVWTFATSRIVFVKQLGVGIGVAVLIDATIVRALLVPSLMRLLGDWNWWAPRFLRRPGR